MRAINMYFRFIVVVGALLSCSNGQESAPGAAATTTSTPTDSLYFASSPLVHIGTDATSDIQFGHVVDVVFSSDNSVLAADAYSNSISEFSVTDGSLLRTIAHLSHRPGEFGQLDRIFVASDRTLVAFDRGDRRLVHFDSTGTYLGSTRLSVPAGVAGYLPVGLWNDSQILALAIRNPDFDRLQRGTVFRDTSEVILLKFRQGSKLLAEVSPQGTLASVPGSENFVRKDHPATIRLPFGQRWTIFADRERLVYGFGEQPAAIIQAGRKQPITIPLENRKRDVTQSDIKRMKELLIRRASRDERGHLATSSVVKDFWEKAFSDMPLPNVMPQHGTIVADDADRIWVQDYQPEYDRSPARWTVYALAGERLFSITCPEGFSLRSVRGNRASGVLTDDLDMETLAVFNLKVAE